MKVYVASSWRNEFFRRVINRLRADGHDVYDFTGKDSFSWSSIDANWQSWDPSNYMMGLLHPLAERGFNRDMTALRECDACIYVTPCGVSASLEAGWAAGAGKLVLAYLPMIREPELMIKIADFWTNDLDQISMRLGGKAKGGAA